MGTLRPVPRWPTPTGRGGTGAAPLQPPRFAACPASRAGRGRGGSPGAGVQGTWEGACQEQMRPACVSGPVPGLRRSPGPPLSARGAEAAAREGHARLRESQAPRRSLAAPARLAPACERHGGLDVLLIKLEARRSGLVGKRRTGRGALELAPSRRGPSCGRPLRTPNPWEPPSLRPSMWGDAASPLGPQGAIRWEAQGGKNPPMGSGHHRSPPPGSAPATRRPQAGRRAGGEAQAHSLGVAEGPGHPAECTVSWGGRFW